MGYYPKEIVFNLNQPQGVGWGGAAVGRPNLENFQMAIMHVNFQISSIEIKKTQLLRLNHPITKSLLTTPSAMT